MTVKFHKYQGTGNDFVMIDNRNLLFKPTTELVKKMCDRRFGIGADGLILLQLINGYDFEMVYFNSDGRASSMCGNGGRCIVKFAYDLGIVSRAVSFMAVDGAHEATILENGNVSLKMNDVKNVKNIDGAYELNTGSPHFIQFVAEVDKVDIVPEARLVRYGNLYATEGINVNFVEKGSNIDRIKVRTYERGVEDETYSCGTGVVAAAIATQIDGGSGSHQVLINTKGGQLEVHFIKGEGKFSEVYLVGPATMAFQGEYST